MIVRVWNADVEGGQNPLVDFVRQYIAGRRTIVFSPKELPVKDTGWLASTCEAMRQLPRRQLCALYLYSTTIDYMISAFLRTGALPTVARVSSWPTHVYPFAAAHTRNLKRFRSEYNAGPALLAQLDRFAAHRAGTPNEQRTKEWYDRADAIGHDINAAARRESKTLSAAFHADVLDFMMENSDAYALFDQARRVLPGVGTLAKWKRAMPTVTQSDWTRIMATYVQDADAVFDALPALPKAMTVYRGARGRVRVKNASYTSTTLAKQVAKNFTGPSGCCIRSIRIPAGTHVVPMLPITRYSGELEILLPRNFHAKQPAA